MWKQSLLCLTYLYNNDRQLLIRIQVKNTEPAFNNLFIFNCHALVEATISLLSQSPIEE